MIKAVFWPCEKCQTQIHLCEICKYNEHTIIMLAKERNMYKEMVTKFIEKEKVTQLINQYMKDELNPHVERH